MTQRNSPARAFMLEQRMVDQRARAGGRHIFVRGKLVFRREVHPAIVPASINRRTGKPHEHNRVKARHAGRIRS